MNKVIMLTTLFIGLGLSYTASSEPLEVFRPKPDVWFKITTEAGKTKDCFNQPGYGQMYRVVCINPPEAKESHKEVTPNDFPSDGEPRKDVTCQ